MSGRRCVFTCSPFSPWCLDGILPSSCFQDFRWALSCVPNFSFLSESWKDYFTLSWNWRIVPKYAKVGPFSYQPRLKISKLFQLAVALGLPFREMISLLFIYFLFSVFFPSLRLKLLWRMASLLKFFFLQLSFSINLHPLTVLLLCPRGYLLHGILSYKCKI